MFNYQFWQAEKYSNVLEFENQLRDEEYEWKEIQMQKEIDDLHELAELQLEIN